ncbi:hypothetical protein B0H66DRAFT_642786 [Apodospora peruviana]|uniref:Rhodopsin domain-containing protein n=1 Tax=Apodospora peruviana TaxID=516989 RepID=A0AAE0HZA8_9PEZI|nr:hypothetical protein B0H66DRAFT_642786 [Apodospora peruviana]
MIKIRTSSPYVAIEKDKCSMVLAVTSTMMVIATVCFALRCWVRRQRKLRFGPDDWLLLSSFISAWAVYSTMTAHIIYGGLGKDIRTSLGTIRLFTRFIYAQEILIPLSVTLTKLSILAMYVRTFPSRFMKLSCKVVGILTLIWCAGVIFPSIFQCVPVKKAWDPFVPGTCNTAISDWISWQDSIPEFASTVIVFALPIYEVWRLCASVRTKLAISAVFIVASLSVVSSVARFVRGYEMHAARTSDGGSDLEFYANMRAANMIAELFMWGHIEVCVGFIAACLPALRPVVVILLQKMGIMTEKKGRTPPRSDEIVTFGRTGVKLNKACGRHDSDTVVSVGSEADGADCEYFNAKFVPAGGYAPNGDHNTLPRELHGDRVDETEIFGCQGTDADWWEMRRSNGEQHRV